MIFHTRSTYRARRKDARVAVGEWEDSKLDIAHLRLTVSETIAWCQPRVNADEPATCLRSDALCPPGWPTQEYGFTYSSFPVEKRSELLRRESVDLNVPFQGLADDRLLLFYFDDCLYEGAVQAESNGYIGDHEEPPWDTWVHCGSVNWHGEQKYRTSYLLSWVPREFVTLVDYSFSVMTSEWLDWIEETEPSL